MKGGDSELRGWLQQVEADLAPGDEVGALATAAFLAARQVNFEEDELRGALRRALLLLAAGGDPRRGLELDSRAVTALADDLDAPEPRAELAAALLELRQEAAGLPSVDRALGKLLGDADLAWRCLAAALLAEELAD